ncbi:hyperosmotically inducible protein [Pseudoxanthomonas sp. CF385]|uniref:BON domain-containing protein n=1 Tax=Pseudoxanthomonas sp. CF385 TaxID=1881042 RepID=UPI0008922AB3|nr:BON domain-containing protein [Pseudoxanthomonas sp. CF385]SDQ25886.1 hyperosmotically inducible protein [Pseudoxanthomonas sp. CF385]
MKISNMALSALAVAMLAAPGFAFAYGDGDKPKAAAEHAQHKDSAQPVDDTWITTKVKADLLTSSNVPGTEIKVETVNGVVTLSGTISSQAEKDKALKVARGIKGVKTVESAGLKVATR